MLSPPAHSPSDSPRPAADALLSRKRQRSQSMASEPSSSSPKRAISEDPSGTQDTHPASQLSDATAPPSSDPALDSEIDAYMAEQGGPPEAPPSLDPPRGPAPPQKLRAVQAECMEPMKVGQTWYIVSRRWYRRFEKACSGVVDKEGGVDEKDLGPVDLSDLVDSAGRLTSACIEHVDVEFVPETAWRWLVEWYGEPGFVLPRKVISRGLMGDICLELRPPLLNVHVLTQDAAPDVVDNPYDVTVSENDTIQTVCDTVYERVVGEKHVPSRQYRIWKLADGTTWETLPCSPEMLKQRGGTLLGDMLRTVVQEMLNSDDSLAIEFFWDGKWAVDASEVPASGQGASTSAGQSPDAGGQMTLFNPQTNFFGPMSPSKPSTALTTTISSHILKPAVTTGKSGYNNNKKETTIEPGTLGLGNMGNTCFMNSALQCLAHCPELAEYFLTGVFEDELNVDNPLGMQGAIANAYGALLRRIWQPTSSSTSYSPREFKQALARFAPQFTGYQQQDSQELVAFLLDGLHEDLNRILKKPYVEKPDWEGGGDLELVKLARESWEGYLKRNDSVIVDLFQGQYQSTLVCPECSKVSITFDPFMYLTLPLPVQKKWAHKVFYVPWDLDKPHAKVQVELNRDASFKDLRQLMGRWMGAEPDHLLTLEVFNYRFYKNLDDTVPCGDALDADVLVCFELPCHAQQSRNYKPQPDDPFIVPVFLADILPRNSYSRNQNLFGYPFIAVIDREQATSPDAMYDAVVDRLQRWTTNARDLFTWEAGPALTNGDAALGADEVVHIPITGPADKITEIKENGEVVTMEAPEEEGDIADEKEAVVRGEHDAMETEPSSVAEQLRKIGFKRDIFRLRVQSGNVLYGVGYGTFPSNNHTDTWEGRLEAAAKAQDAGKPGVLLRSGDVLYCEFDENMKAYYFSVSEANQKLPWEADSWEPFIHPELAAANKAAAAKKNKGITLQDCLDEFTKEEQLGEDDLWYCPRCKKHQQATKRFDLWSVPDMLVVHLKRFSNSRTLRDKIDTFVDFPIEGLDLTDMVGERRIAKRLTEQGLSIEEAGLSDTEEPLVYDLYAVDEHLGGLGGGHYRAYAANHATGQWYHFDDSYVTPASAGSAVNSNAYLLFYKRRASRPLGGKTHARVEAAKNKPKDPEPPTEPEGQLPTPPDDPVYPSSAFKPKNSLPAGKSLLDSRLDSLAEAEGPFADGWPTPTSDSRSSPASSPPPLDDADAPPSFEESQYTTPLDALAISTHQFDYPDPSTSPSSSVEAEPEDPEEQAERMQWSSTQWPHDLLELDNVGSPQAVSMDGYNLPNTPPDDDMIAISQDGEVPADPWADELITPKETEDTLDSLESGFGLGL